MQETEKYKLKKPSTEDFFNIEDFNKNTDKIEQALKENAENLDVKITDVNKNLGTVNTQISTLKGNVADLNTNKLDKTEFDNLQIGGRNLMPNTLTLKGYRRPSTATESTYKGFTVYENTFTASPSVHDLGLNNFIEPEPNTDYVFSFWAKGEGTISSYFYPSVVVKAEHCEGATSTAVDGRIYTTLSPEWKRYWVKWTTRSDVSGIKSIVLCRQSDNDSKVSFYGAQLERGTKPTDWTPAPEDIQDQINNVQNPVFDDSGAVEGISSFTDFLNSVKTKMNIFQFYRDFKAGMKYVLHTGRLVNNAVTTEEGFALDARMGKTLQDQITDVNNNLAPKQVTLSLTFDTYQGSIKLIKSGKTVQIFCDICAKAPIPTLTKIADVPSDFLPQMGYLSCLTNRGTGQSVPVFIGNDGIFRTTELLGLEANVVYYGAGCYVCK